MNNNDKTLKLSDFDINRIRFHFQNAKDRFDRVKHDNSKYSPSSKKGKYGIYSYLKPDGTLRFHVGDRAKSQIQEAYYVSLDTVAPAIIASREPKLWDLERKFSVDECKLLQGFPKEFKMKVSDLQAKKQLGNAISIPVVQEIVKNMLYYYKTESNWTLHSDNYINSSIDNRLLAVNK